jgi:hypothetical protein
MSSMTAQMDAMTKNILASKYNRVSALADFTSYTRSLLVTYRQDREMTTAAQNNALSSGTKELAKNNRIMLSKFQQDRIQEGKEQRKAGKEMRASLTVDRLGREQVTKLLIQDFRSSRSKNTHAQTKELKGFVRGMQTEVEGLIKHAHDSRYEMGRETAKMLQETVAAVRQQTDEITAHSRGLVKEFQHSRIAMGKQLEKQLIACTNERQHDVNKLLDGFRSSQHLLQQDLVGAKQAWLASGSAAEKSRMPTFDIQKMKHLPEVSEEAWTLRIISEHPEGISALQVGEMMRIDTLMVGHITKKLAENGKIRKDKKTRLYFPSTDEAQGEAS